MHVGGLEKRAVRVGREKIFWAGLGACFIRVVDGGKCRGGRIYWGLMRFGCFERGTFGRKRVENDVDEL